MKPLPPNAGWLELLTEEDITFIKRFLFVSGSLKELAAAYHVTYPTVRLRLDRLLEKLKAFDSLDNADDFERTLRGAFAEGKMDQSTFRQLLESYRRQQTPQ